MLMRDKFFAKRMHIPYTHYRADLTGFDMKTFHYTLVIVVGIYAIFFFFLKYRQLKSNHLYQNHNQNETIFSSSLRSFITRISLSLCNHYS